MSITNNAIATLAARGGARVPSCPKMTGSPARVKLGGGDGRTHVRKCPKMSDSGRAFYNAARATLFVVALLVACRASVAHAAIPGAENKKAFTQRDYQKALFAYNQRTLTHAYKENGKKDPKWDAAAIKFLDAMALRFTNASGNDWSTLPGQAGEAELLKLADAAIAAGCEDALVTYCRAVLLDDAKRTSPAEVGPVVQSAAQQMFEGKYPVNRALSAYRRMYRLTDKSERARCEEVLNSIYDLTTALVVHWKYAQLDQRIILANVWEDVAADPPEWRTKLIDAINAAGDACDPWMRQMILGRHEIKLAWDARGTGFANTVGREGWRGFEEHLTKAKEHLAKAHEIKPTFPEAAVDMMDVELGQGGNGRAWFERATAAQFDYYAAYRGLLWSLRPRWHGSHEEMYAFGVECLQTKRFDTSVPAFFLKALNDVAEDAESPAIYSRPGVWEKVNECFVGQLAQGGSFANESFYPSYHAAFAWRCGQFAEARKLFDKLGASMNERPFLNFNVMPRLARSHAYAMRDELSTQIGAAEQQASAGDPGGASAAYDKLAASLKPDDPASYYLRSRRTQLAWQQKFDAGEWVDLKPDKSLHGWQPILGTWTVNDDGSVDGVVNDGGCWMLCQANFLGGDFEVEVTLELPDDGKGSVAGGVGVANPSDLR